MPKINNQFLIVKIKDTNIIRIYNIKLQRYTREFSLCKDEPTLEDLALRNQSDLQVKNEGFSSKKSFIEIINVCLHIENTC